MYATRLATALLLLPAALAAQTRDPINTIAVNANATVERVPDRAKLSVAVVSEGSTAQAASQANANLMTRVVAALADMGISGQAVRTTSLQIGPQYERSPGQPPRISGYTATNMVEITIDSIARTGAITDAVIGAGANNVTGLSFELKDAEGARREALVLAVRKARAEAEAVAAASDRVLGSAIRIDVDPEAGRPMFRAMAARADMAESSTPVEPGAIEITASVRILYRMLVR